MPTSLIRLSFNSLSSSGQTPADLICQQPELPILNMTQVPQAEKFKSHKNKIIALWKL